jgi:YD repeat-containing protein
MKLRIAGLLIGLVNLPASLLSFAAAYTYDKLEHLTTETCGNDSTKTCYYDAAGNIRSKYFCIVWMWE